MFKSRVSSTKTVNAAKPAAPFVPAKKASPVKPARRRATPPAAAKPPQPAESPKPGKVGKPRQKPVRDSFTMPAADFALIAALKARLLAAKQIAKKSELLRAGLHALAELDTAALVAAIGKLDPVKVGRPKKGH